MDAAPPPKLPQLRMIWGSFAASHVAFGLGGTLAAGQAADMATLSLVLPFLAFAAPPAALFVRRTLQGGALAIAPTDTDPTPATADQRRRYTTGLIVGLAGAEASSLLGLVGAVAAGLPVAPFVGWGLLFALAQFPTEAGIRQIR